LDQLVEALVRALKAFNAGPDAAGGGLSSPQVATLRALRNRSPRRITALAEDGRCDPSVLSRQIAALESCGLVARSRDPDDGRAFLVELTDLGRQALGRYWSARIGQLRGELDDFSDQELIRAAALLERIADAWRPKSTASPPRAAEPATDSEPID
jgi:DNA-binding MarR family transcriptional regulator